MRALKKKLCLIVAIIAMLCMSFPVYATEDNATNAIRESILLVTLGYEDDNGNYTAYKAGTCFVINEEYVLTNKHIVTLTRSELKEMGDMVGNDDLKATDEHICLMLYVNRDMTAKVTLGVSSDNMDFAALQLENPNVISDRTPVKLGDSDSVQTTDPVWAMGFPADSISTKDYHTEEDVSTVNGAISKVTETGNVDIFEHTAPLNEGNSGGPLLDDNNNVIGINTFMSGEGKKAYAIQINHIKDALDDFGISYTSGDGAVAASNDAETDSEEAAEDLTAERSELQAVLDEAKSEDAANYTEESAAALNDSIAAAEAVLNRNDASREDLLGATDALNEALEGLEEKSGINMLLIGIIAAAVIIVIVIIIVIVKKKPTPKPVPAPQTAPSSGSRPHMSGTEPMQKSQPVMQHTPEGAGETSLLDSGAGETTLLSNTGSAYLIRKKNGEKIPVNLQTFRIGKERNKVDYCISDNTSVSRVHCIIMKKGADYYVVDQGSTNFTFVNNIQSGAKRETLLSDQSVLKLSDEEFEFHLS